MNSMDVTFGIPKLAHVEWPPMEYNYSKNDKEIPKGTSYSYPGDKGYVIKSKIRIPIIHPRKGEIGERWVNSLVFDSKFCRDSLLTNRLVTGDEAEYPYRVCCYTVAKFLKDNFPILLKNSCEQQILRAGRAMSIAEYVPDMESRAADFKRHSVENEAMYIASPSKIVYWSDHENQWPVDICPASGSTDVAIVKSCFFEEGKALNAKRIIFNNSTGTLFAIARSAIEVPENIEIWRINWGGLFSIYRKDITLENGEIIYGGTLININPDEDDPRNTFFVPPGMIEYLHDIFNKNGSRLLDDIPGEVGEKIQNKLFGPLIYDLLSSFATGWDLTHPIWIPRFLRAMEVPGLQKNLKDKAPQAYAFHMHNYHMLKSVIKVPISSYGTIFNK